MLENFELTCGFLGQHLDTLIPLDLVDLESLEDALGLRNFIRQGRRQSVRCGLRKLMLLLDKVLLYKFPLVLFRVLRHIRFTSLKELKETLLASGNDGRLTHLAGVISDAPKSGGQTVPARRRPQKSAHHAKMPTLLGLSSSSSETRTDEDRRSEQFEPQQRCHYDWWSVGECLTRKSDEAADQRRAKADNALW
jgi:hypothetical protein